MLLLAALCLAGLTPGIATGWYLHHKGHGWLLAAGAGTAVTLAMPAALLAPLVLFPPIGVVVGVLAVIAALHAYDEGRVWVAAVWAAAATIALSCAGWAAG